VPLLVALRRGRLREARTAGLHSDHKERLSCPTPRLDLTDVRAVVVTACPLLAAHPAAPHPGVHTALLTRLVGIGRVDHRVATTYRAGPLLLAGDAAPVHSPTDGQGMNTGIQDALDLGTTLLQALRQGAPTTALDGYTRRRRPLAQRIVTLTDRATRAATLTSPAARNTALGLASRVPVVQQRLARQLVLPSHGPQCPIEVGGPARRCPARPAGRRVAATDSRTTSPRPDDRSLGQLFAVVVRQLGQGLRV